MNTQTTSFILITLLVAGCAGTRQLSSPPAVDSPKTTAIAEIPPPASTPPSLDSMRKLGTLASTGDLTAIDQMEDIRNALYENIDRKDTDRIRANLKLMRAAFSEIGRSVAQSDDNDPAFKSLVYANGKSALRSFTSDAFGIAAAKGHSPSLDILLHHNRHGILLSSATFALCKPAENGNEEAVLFLSEVMNNDRCRPLWHAASRGLIATANRGHKGAQQALSKFDDYKKEQMNTKVAKAP